MEEQFYAFWPFLVKKSKRLLLTLISLLLAFLIAKVALIHFDTYIFKINIFDLLGFFPFDCMMIGGIAACLYDMRSNFLKFIYYPIIQALAWSFFLISIFYKPVQVPIPFQLALNKDIHAAVYAILILNVSTNPNTLINLENKLFNYLGKLSYGIYAFHFIVLFILSLGLRYILPNLHSLFAHAIMFSAEISTTILFCHLSFKYFESYFMSKKEEYTVIYSTNENKEVAIPISEGIAKF